VLPEGVVNLHANAECLIPQRLEHVQDAHSHAG
jgi:hypothetical protein